MRPLLKTEPHPRFGLRFLKTPIRWFLSLVSLCIFVACAAPKRAIPERSANSAGRIPSRSVMQENRNQNEDPFSGTFDWLFTTRDQQGDLRIEQEEWRLSRTGDHLAGTCLRQVLTLSADRTPFRCNGLLGFEQVTRVELVGKVSGDTVVLTETAAVTEPSLCPAPRQALRTYRGERQGARLVLSSLEGSQRLTFRDPKTNIPPLQTPMEVARASPSEETASPFTGVFVFEHRAQNLASGRPEVHIEREEWNLVDQAGEMVGYCDRVVERTREEGVFPCNQSSTIRTTTRYTLRGRRTGASFVLHEVDQRTEPNPCDNGARRLDSYQGRILEPGTLLLRSPSTDQILVRKPTAPKTSIAP